MSDIIVGMQKSSHLVRNTPWCYQKVLSHRFKGSVMNIVLTLSAWAHCVKSFYDKGLLIKDVLFKHQELSVNFSIN